MSGAGGALASAGDEGGQRSDPARAAGVEIIGEFIGEHADVFVGEHELFLDAQK